VLGTLHYLNGADDGKSSIQNGLNLLDCFKSANFFLSSSNFFLRFTKSMKKKVKNIFSNIYYKYKEILLRITKNYKVLEHILLNVWGDE
jgi:ABC-type arginine transport system ATPase subunit